MQIESCYFLSLNLPANIADNIQRQHELNLLKIHQLKKAATKQKDSGIAKKIIQ